MSTNSDSNSKYNGDDINKILEFLVDNFFEAFGGNDSNR